MKDDSRVEIQGNSKTFSAVIRTPNHHARPTCALQHLPPTGLPKASRLRPCHRSWTRHLLDQIQGSPWWQILRQTAPNPCPSQHMSRRLAGAARAILYPRGSHRPPHRRSAKAPFLPVQALAQAEGGCTSHTAGSDSRRVKSHRMVQCSEMGGQEWTHRHRSETPCEASLLFGRSTCRRGRSVLVDTARRHPWSPRCLGSSCCLDRSRTIYTMRWDHTPPYGIARARCPQGCTLCCTPRAPAGCFGLYQL